MENNLYLLIFVGLSGLCLGSFANVLIYRIPEKKSILFPESFCPQCQHKISWYDNIPCLSFLILGGKCRHCQAKISWQYPVFELITAISIFLLWINYHQEVFLLIGYTIFVFLLIVISGIDFNHNIIPDQLSLPLIIIGLLFSLINPYLGETFISRILNSVAGAVSGFVGFYLISVIGGKVFKKEALGGGDIKLVSGLGAFLGWQKLLISVFLGSLIGSILSLILIYIVKKKSWGQYLPYGPFLAIGAILTLLFLNNIKAFY